MVGEGAGHGAKRVEAVRCGVLVFSGQRQCDALLIREINMNIRFAQNKRIPRELPNTPIGLKNEEKRFPMTVLVPLKESLAPRDRQGRNKPFLFPLSPFPRITYLQVVKDGSSNSMLPGRQPYLLVLDVQPTVLA